MWKFLIDIGAPLFRINTNGKPRRRRGRNVSIDQQIDPSCFLFANANNE